MINVRERQRVTGFFLVSVAVLAISSEVWAESTKRVAPSAVTSRRRVARVAGGSAASLSGRIIDASNGSPLADATVTVQAKSSTSGPDGRYTLPGLQSGSFDVTVQRFGYHENTRILPLVAGSNSLDVSLTPRPAVTVTTTTGEVRRLDFDSVQFGYAMGLIGYRAAPSVDVCRTTGDGVKLEKSQIASISGPSSVSASCCANGQQVTFALKSGETFPATFTDSCFGFTEDLIGRDRTTGANVYLPFSSISRVEFP